MCLSWGGFVWCKPERRIRVTECTSCSLGNFNSCFEQIICHQLNNSTATVFTWSFWLHEPLSGSRDQVRQRVSWQQCPSSADVVPEVHVWLTRDLYCLNLSHYRFPLASQSTRGKNRELLELEAGFSNQTVWLHKHSPIKKTKRNNYFQPAERNNNTTYLIIANNQRELEAKAPSWCQARESAGLETNFST